MAEPTAAYCDPEDLMDRLSALGVQLHSDDGGQGGDDGSVSEADKTAVEEAMCLRATDDVYFYLGSHYNESDLAASRWVKNRTVDLALYYLDTRRGDPANEAIKADFERSLEILEKINAGKLRIAELPKRKPLGGVPAISNQRVRLDPHPRVVTERKRSTGKPEDYTKHDDKTEWLDPSEMY